MTSWARSRACEFGEQVADVGLHGPVADVQVVADLLVGQAASDQREHLALPFGHAVEAVQR